MASNDSTAIRLAALIKLVDDRGIGPTDLAALSASTLGVTPKRVSFWSDVMSGRKSFGEKLAREVEMMFQLSRGELDKLIGTPAPSFGQLNGFEGQLVTLYRMLSQQEQDDLLVELNRRHNKSNANKGPTAANPYPRKKGEPLR
jgi:hypothetical protein